MSLSPIKTYWRVGPLACALYTGDGTFELRLVEGQVTHRRESCTSSADALEKSRQWHREVLNAPPKR